MSRRLSLIIAIVIMASFAEAATISNAIYPVHYFSGRQSEIRKIDKLFNGGKSVVSIVGISGIGKTVTGEAIFAQKKIIETIDKEGGSFIYGQG